MSLDMVAGIGDNSLSLQVNIELCGIDLGPGSVLLFEIKFMVK
jgi:hypothetical protein